MDRLLLPEKTSKQDCKMVLLGYRSIKHTGGKKINAKTTKTYIITNGNTTSTTTTFTANTLMPVTTATATFTTLNNNITGTTINTVSRAMSYSRPSEGEYREVDPSLCYCFKCKKPVQAKIEKYAVNGSNSVGHYSEEIYECPECGQRVHEDDIFKLKTTYTVHRTYFLDGHMLKIKRKEYMFNWYNNHLIIDEYRHYLSMNLDTGYTYKLPIMKNGKLMKGGLTNVTYYTENERDRRNRVYSSKCRNYDEFYIEVYNLVREYKMKKMNIFIPTYEFYYDENKKTIKKGRIAVSNFLLRSPDVEYIAMLNRFPTMPLEYALKHFNQSNKGNRRFIRLRRSIKSNTTDPMKDILEFYKMPTSKTNKKRVIKCFNYPLYFKRLSAIIDNYDNVNKVLNDEFLTKASNYDIDTLVTNLEIVKGIKGFNLNSFCNRVQGETVEIVVDALKLCAKVYKKKPDYLFNFKCKLKELHDTLSKDYNKLDHANIVIEYDEQYKTLEGQYGELQFHFAKDTYELIDIGTEMNICVGSYGDRAANKSLNIMVARYENGTPAVCIEMDKYYYGIRQTKQKHNNRHKAFNEIESPVELNAVVEWARTHSLRFNTLDVPDEIKEEHNQLPEVIKKGKIIDDMIAKIEAERIKETKLNQELHNTQLATTFATMQPPMPAPAINVRAIF